MARLLVAAAIAFGAILPVGGATAACPADLDIRVCNDPPVRVPHCEVDTYRKLVTCERPIG